jgi:hypothetical protein
MDELTRRANIHGDGVGQIAAPKKTALLGGN